MSIESDGGAAPQEAAPEVQPQAEMESPEVSEEAPIQASGEAEDQLRQDVKEAVAAGASEEEVRDMIREFELKVNGKTLKKKIDLSDEEALKRELQLAAAGRESMQKSKELEKTYREAIQSLLKDPAAGLAELGIDVEDFAAGYIENKLKEYEKSPEEKEQERIQRELEQYRQEVERLKKEKEDSDFQTMVEKEAQKLDQEIEEAFNDPSVKIPRTRETVMRIARYLEWAEDQVDEDKFYANIASGMAEDRARDQARLFRDVKVKDVLPLVEQDYRKEFQSVADGLGDDLLEEYFGRKVFDRYRKSRIEKAQKPLSTKVEETAKPRKVPGQPKKRTVRDKDFFRELSKKYKF